MDSIPTIMTQIGHSGPSVPLAAVSSVGVLGSRYRMARLDDHLHLGSGAAVEAA